VDKDIPFHEIYPQKESNSFRNWALFVEKIKAFFIYFLEDIMGLVLKQHIFLNCSIPSNTAFKAELFP